MFFFLRRRCAYIVVSLRRQSHRIRETHGAGNKHVLSLWNACSDNVHAWKMCHTFLDSRKRMARNKSSTWRWVKELPLCVNVICTHRVVHSLHRGLMVSALRLLRFRTRSLNAERQHQLLNASNTPWELKVRSSTPSTDPNSSCRVQVERKRQDKA